MRAWLNRQVEHQSPVELDFESVEKAVSYKMKDVVGIPSPKELHAKDENYEMRNLVELAAGRDGARGKR